MSKSTPKKPPADTQPTRTLSLASLLYRRVIARDGHPVGRVLDVVAKRSDEPTLAVTGLLIAVDDKQVLVPIQQVTALSDAVRLDSVAGLDTPFQREPAHLLLVADMLARRLIDLRRPRLVRARDIDLAPRDGRWLVAGVDVEWGGRRHLLTGRRNRHHAHRAWHEVEPF